MTNHLTITCMSRSERVKLFSVGEFGKNDHCHEMKYIKHYLTMASFVTCMRGSSVFFFESVDKI